MRAGRRSLALHLAIAGGVLGWVAVALIHGGGLTFFDRYIPVPGGEPPVAALRETLLALFTTGLLTDLAVQTDETIGLTGHDAAEPTLAVVARGGAHGAYRGRPVALAYLGGCYRDPAMHAEVERGGVAGERT